MRKILIILTLITLCSCSGNNFKTENSLVGIWELDQLEIGFIHGVFEAPYDKSIEINSNLINPNFKIALSHDLTVKIENEDGSIDEGIYQYSTDSLIIRKDNYDWLKFKIEDQTDQNLKLKIDGIRFYNIENDSIEIFTGDNIKMKFKLLDRNF